MSRRRIEAVKGRDAWRETLLLASLALACLCPVGSRAFAAGQPAIADEQQQGIADPVQPEQVQPQQAGPEQLDPDVRAMLARFGTFTQDNLYGEVWITTVTPQGWHPYPPCHWVKAKRFGFYFDDRTDWGRIVHHFGRWVHDGQRGWMWVPGNQYSVGWVVWRSSPTWTGWAPLPPDVVTDTGATAADMMAGADSWLFQETPRLIVGCKADRIAAPAEVALRVADTPYVTRLGFVSGLMVFIVPAWVGGPFIDVDVSFTPWPSWFVAAVSNQWNWVWHHTTIANVKTICIRKPKAI